MEQEEYARKLVEISEEIDMVKQRNGLLGRELLSRPVCRPACRGKKENRGKGRPQKRPDALQPLRCIYTNL